MALMALTIPPLTDRLVDARIAAELADSEGAHTPEQVSRLNDLIAHARTREEMASEQKALRKRLYDTPAKRARAILDLYAEAR